MTVVENKNQIDLLIRTFKMMERMIRNQPDANPHIQDDGKDDPQSA